MLRILCATNHAYLPQFTGGAEVSTHQMCTAFLERGHPVAVLASLEAHDWIGWWARLRRVLSRSRKYPADTVMGYPVYRGWEPVHGVTEMVRRFRPDVAMMRAGQPMQLAHAFLAERIPVIVYLHDTFFDQFGGEIVDDPLLAFVANSEYTARRFFEFSGIEAAQTRSLVIPETYRVESTREKVVFVNPVPEKGLDVALALAERRPDIEFDFIESWTLYPDRRAELQRHASRLGNVTIINRTSDMRKVYGRAKILLAPSQYKEGVWAESWCRTGAEAQVSGIPVIATNGGGLPESVGPGGILVDPDADISAWENALSTLWDDDGAYERASSAALEHSRRAEIQPDRIVDDLLDLISTHLHRATAHGLNE